MSEVIIDKKEYVILPKKEYDALKKTANRKVELDELMTIEKARKYSRKLIEKWAKEMSL